MNPMEQKTTGKVHHGRNIKRLREILGLKQEAVAQLLNITQQSLSELEKREIIEDNTIDKVARALEVPPSAIKNMTEESVINYINTFNDKIDNISGGAFSGGTFNGSNTNCTFNPLDKVVELYERMLKERDEKIVSLEKLLNEKSK